MATECIFNQRVDERFTINCIVVHEHTQTQLVTGDHLDTIEFVKMPKIGEYILSHSRTNAYRILRLQRTKTSDVQLIVLFVSDPTNVLEHNPAPDKIKKRGLPVHVHNSKCTSHCIDIYYLGIIKGYEIDIVLL
jgi:hypothetical protein